ncbi:MAG: ROK family protein [Acidimicrobiales bacterium]
MGPTVGPARPAGRILAPPGGSGGPHRMRPGQFHAVPEAAAKAVEMARLTWPDVVAVGVGIAGLVDSHAGMVIDAGNLGWHDLALGPELSRHLGVPVVIENDVCASAVAELAVRPGGPVSPWLYLSVGTGVGACVVLDTADGHPLCLNVGHLPVPGGSLLCPCGKYGCLETVASGTAFTRAASARIAADPDHALHSRAATITGKDVVDSAMDGDAISLEVLATAGAACGYTVANLVNMFIPAGVGLAGGMIAPGSPYLVALLDAARRDITQWMQARFEFGCGRVGETAGVTGVVELARRRLAGPPVPRPQPGAAVTPGA